MTLARLVGVALPVLMLVWACGGEDSSKESMSSTGGEGAGTSVGGNSATSTTGGGDPGVGGSNPGVGGSNPGVGGSNPGVGGSNPGVGGSNPGVGGSDPGVGGSNPGVGGSDPGVGGSDPGVGGSDPGVGGSNPGVGGSNPGVGGSDPGVGGSDPGVGGSNPGVGGSDPGVGGSNPGVGGSNPGVGGSDPGVGGSTGTDSDGCTVNDAPTGVQELTTIVAGDTREYVLVVPAEYDSARRYPLIFAWHGLGGNGPMARMYFGLTTPVDGDAIVVYPSALPLESMEGQTGWDLAADGVDVTFFDTLRTDIESQYCIDTTRVFSTGHSFGGMMTNALGCYRGDVLRAVAPVAGYPPFGNPTCVGQVAAMVIHGENDGTVDYTTGGVAAKDRYREANTCLETSVATEPSPCITYDECDEGFPVTFCTHQDDHNWPSFAGAGIWDFFSAL